MADLAEDSEALKRSFFFRGFFVSLGVATGAGVALGLYPYLTYPVLVALVVWGALFWLSRYVSLASIVAAIVLPIAMVAIGGLLGWGVFGAQLPILVFACLVAALVVWRHRSNIARLRAGTEHRFTGKATS